MAAEHQVHSGLIQDRGEVSCEPGLGIPAGSIVNQRDMTDGHFDGSFGEKRIFNCFAQPFQFCLPV